VDYFIGLDLGQAAAFTALAVLERTASTVPADLGTWTYALCRLERFPPGTRYREVIARLRTLLTAQPPGHVYPPLNGAKLAVDQTGVGEAVVRLFREAELPARVQPVFITGGHRVQFDQGVYYTPQKELVSTLQVLIEGRRLQFHRAPLHETLAKQIPSFHAKITAGGMEPTPDWREREHDDLVLALALACWLADREPGGEYEMPCAGRPRAW
jgi:hypothetical protein